MARNDDEIDYIFEPISTDRDALQQAAFDYLASRWEDWTPEESNLEAWVVAACSSMVAEARDVASRVVRDIFRYWGTTIFGIAPLDPSPSTVYSTWTFGSNAAGRDVDSGTLVNIEDDNGQPHIFEVVADHHFDAGVLSSDVGGIALRSTEDGTEHNDLGGSGTEIFPIDQFTWVSTVTLTGSTTNGSDGETTDDYLGRLSRHLSLLTPRPILSDNFEDLSEDTAEHQNRHVRALAIDGYNPATDTYGNERMVTMAYIDADTGLDLDVPTRDDILADLESKREANYVINTVAPTRTAVDFTYAVVALPGVDPVALKAAIDQALADFTDPKNWGLVSGDERGRWRRVDKVRFQNVSAVVRGVQGVSYWTSLTIGLAGDAQVASDRTLPGAAPLTTTGAIVGTVTGS